MKATLKNNPVPIHIYKGTEDAQLFRQRQIREKCFRRYIGTKLERIAEAKERITLLQLASDGTIANSNQIEYWGNIIKDCLAFVAEMKHRYLVRRWALNRIAKNCKIY